MAKNRTFLSLPNLSKNSADKGMNSAISAGLIGARNPSLDASPGGALHQWYKLVTAISTGPISMNYFKEVEESDEDEFLKKFSTRNVNFIQNGTTKAKQMPTRRWTNMQRENSIFRTSKASKRRKAIRHFRKYVIAPDGILVFYWLALISVVVFYNWWTIIVREAFTTSETDYHTMWVQLDLLADFVYFLDIIREIRTGYLEEGLVVMDAIKLCKKYVFSLKFFLDVACLLPIKLFSDWIGQMNHPLMRFLRLIKTHKVMTFVAMIETRTVYPNFIRCANLTHILLLTCHWFACFHFMIAKATGFQTPWSYDWTADSVANMSTQRKYLLSVYWATLTLTTVGNNAVPKTNWEYSFSIISYLFGIFTFATIVGQVGNVIANRNTGRLEFERLLDGAKQYMRHHKVPKSMQKRVQQWYDYSFSRGRMDGSNIESLAVLPDKLKTELSLHVNLDTLKKVSIFRECQPEFLHDLVLKMRAIIFTPGDIVCRKGEVAREMYIIADGVLEVIDEDGEVIHEMRSGEFFGEIGMLNLDGGSVINFRRTADVRSVGYSELFSLAKDDVLTATKDFPEAEDLLRRHGCDRLAREKSLSKLKHQCKKSGNSNAVKAVIGSLSPVLEPSGSLSGEGSTGSIISTNLDALKDQEIKENSERNNNKTSFQSEEPTKTFLSGIRRNFKATAESLDSTGQFSARFSNSLRHSTKVRGTMSSCGVMERRRSSVVPSLVTNLLGCRVIDSPGRSRAVSVRVPGKSATVLKARSLDRDVSPMGNSAFQLRVAESDLANLFDRLLLLVPPRLREDLRTEIRVINDIFNQVKFQLLSLEEIIALKRKENARLKDLLMRLENAGRSEKETSPLVEDEQEECSDGSAAHTEMIV